MTMLCTFKACLNSLNNPMHIFFVRCRIDLIDTTGPMHCLKKHWRLLYSEVTGILRYESSIEVKFFQNSVTRFDRTFHFLIRLILKLLVILIAKLSCSAERRTTQNQNKFQIS